MNDFRQTAVHDLLVRHARCPSYEAPSLEFLPEAVRCRQCDSTFPVVDGAPALMKVDNVVFPEARMPKVPSPPERRTSLSEVFPWKSVNLAAKRVLATFGAEVATVLPTCSSSGRGTSANGWASTSRRTPT